VRNEGFEGFLNLRRVVIAPPQVDDEIRILALEIYDDGFILRFAFSGRIQDPASGGEATLNPMGLMSLTLRDGLSTPYKWSGMIAGSGQGLTAFRPSIPPNAAWLEVLTKGGVVRFELEPADRTEAV
jgi:hypothetical protein